MSEYNITKPCNNCPFRKVGGIRVSRARAMELLNQDGFMPCHKTCVGDGETRTGKERGCAGFAIFLEKINRPSQMMRIAERLGLYDPKKLQGHDEVFDTLGELVRASLDEPMRSRRSRR